MVALAAILRAILKLQMLQSQCNSTRCQLVTAKASFVFENRQQTFVATVPKAMSVSEAPCSFATKNAQRFRSAAQATKGQDLPSVESI